MYLVLNWYGRCDIFPFNFCAFSLFHIFQTFIFILPDLIRNGFQNFYFLEGKSFKS